MRIAIFLVVVCVAADAAAQSCDRILDVGLDRSVTSERTRVSRFAAEKFCRSLSSMDWVSNSTQIQSGLSFLGIGANNTTALSGDQLRAFAEKECANRLSTINDSSERYSEEQKLARSATDAWITCLQIAKDGVKSTWNIQPTRRNVALDLFVNGGDVRFRGGEVVPPGAAKCSVQDTKGQTKPLVLDLTLPLDTAKMVTVRCNRTVTKQTFEKVDYDVMEDVSILVTTDKGTLSIFLPALSNPRLPLKEVKQLNDSIGELESKLSKANATIADQKTKLESLEKRAFKNDDFVSLFNQLPKDVGGMVNSPGCFDRNGARLAMVECKDGDGSGHQTWQLKRKEGFGIGHD